jgi:hypothetical protein
VRRVAFFAGLGCGRGTGRRRGKGLVSARLKVRGSHLSPMVKPQAACCLFIRTEFVAAYCALSLLFRISPQLPAPRHRERERECLAMESRGQQKLHPRPGPSHFPFQTLLQQCTLITTVVELSEKRDTELHKKRLWLCTISAASRDETSKNKYQYKQYKDSHSKGMRARSKNRPHPALKNRKTRKE